MVLIVGAIGALFFMSTGLIAGAPDGTGSGQSARAATDSTTSAVAAVPMPAEVASGDALFKGNCAQCHGINDVVVGPALAGITRRRPVSWLVPWVKNSSKLVASGDAYAVKIFNQYQKQQMPSFQLSDDEIKSILTYVEWESKQGSRAVAVR
ncbi:c-type cytochrome [Hymenobacter translucens]|uniref:c-type cytochrome n=1 Tax=Hymenobacter translucens TaxID=2886507 RepID=UPI001D0ED49A|nr:cytochrome c [Hymenobacter translucens]